MVISPTDPLLHRWHLLIRMISVLLFFEVPFRIAFQPVVDLGVTYVIVWQARLSNRLSSRLSSGTLACETARAHRTRFECAPRSSMRASHHIDQVLIYPLLDCRRVWRAVG